MIGVAIQIVQESWTVLGEMAPYLLFGFLVAGILSVCISPEFVQRHLGGRGFGPVVKAAALGVPLPLCSCGVIPVSASFRRHGASRAAVTSFLLSTPQTGIDSIAVTYALMGWVFATFRPIAALATGLLGGLLVMLFAQTNHENGDASPQKPCTESCCTGRGSTNVIRRALEYGFVTLPRDIGIALLIGVVIAGAISALVPPNQWSPYLGGGVLSIVLMMALGVPLYVCASASVPIAAGLIHAGASPGAALAFLIAGPGTNAATLTTIWKLLGRRTVMLYLLTIALSAVGSGLALDWLMPAMNATVACAGEHAHEAMGGAVANSLWAVALLAVLAYSYAAKPKKTAEHEHGEEDDAPEEAASTAAERVELIVCGMRCNHCLDAVRNALGGCQGVTSVQVDLTSGRTVVTGEHVDVKELIAAVQKVGYEAESAA